MSPESPGGTVFEGRGCWVFVEPPSIVYLNPILNGPGFFPGPRKEDGGDES